MITYAEQRLCIPPEDQFVLEYLFRKIGAVNNVIGRKDANLLSLLKSSNVSSQFLKEIWTETVLPNRNIPLVAFFAMMRLVSMAQSGIRPTLVDMPLTPLPLPTFGTVNMAMIAQEARMQSGQFQQPQPMSASGFAPNPAAQAYPQFQAPAPLPMPMQQLQPTGRRSVSMPYASAMPNNAMGGQMYPQSATPNIHPCFLETITIDEGTRCLKAYAQVRTTFILCYYLLSCL